MIDKRLFDLLGNEKKNIIWIVLARVINLLLSIAFYYMLSFLLRAYLANVDFPPTLILVVFVLAVSLGKLFFNLIVSHSSFLMSSSTRIMLRERIMKKAMTLGPDGRQALSTSELTQVSVEGVEQLEVYYSKFIPQFFYSICSAIIVFIVLARYNFLASFVLLICVPLIPVAIVSVMKFAKKVLSHYWDNYLNLGEQFYENLQGLTTLKLFEQDGVQNEKMNCTALNFRNATMKLLTMQLNSITVMDIVAYGGTALGITLALKDFGHGTMNLDGMVMFILLSAEFFLPFRQLGSLFHVAMTGASAADRMFRFLDLPERHGGTNVLTSKVETITLRDVTFSYNSKEKALDSISLTLHSGQLTGIIGLSGSGKSTLSYLLSGIADGYQGEIDWNQTEMRTLTKEFIEDTVERVSNSGYVFAASIRYNLTFGDASISDAHINEVLQDVNLLEFLASTPEGLDYALTENGANLSGGQRQRLLIARSLLRDKEVYIFDEMTSSVDIESERIIMKTIERLSHNKIVVFISHRLYNVANADQLVVLKQGQIVEQGKPDVLLSSGGYYSEAYKVEQLTLEEGGN